MAVCEGVVKKIKINSCYIEILVYICSYNNNNNMKNYTHQTGTKIKGYASHKEHTFYETTTKRQMFLIIEQMATLLKEDSAHWVDKAANELEILKLNNIK